MCFKFSKGIIWILLLLFIICTPVMAEVVVFDHYDTNFKLEGDKLFIEKSITIKNVGSSPIIPGEIHFQLSHDGFKETPKISGFSVIDFKNKELDTKLVERDDQTSLVFTVWDPLLPKFFYKVTMKYEVEFSPRGILFYSIELPEEKTTIPIKNENVVFNLPKKYHFTYAPEADIDVENDMRTASWSEASVKEFEYSMIPFPRFGIRAVNLFWWIIIIICFVQLFFRMKRNRRL